VHSTILDFVPPPSSKNATNDVKSPRAQKASQSMYLEIPPKETATAKARKDQKLDGKKEIEAVAMGLSLLKSESFREPVQQQPQPEEPKDEVVIEVCFLRDFHTFFFCSRILFVDSC
jgi:hypothetical protein